MLFNEPKLLKFYEIDDDRAGFSGFSALQRAEIAEIRTRLLPTDARARFSALQRAEIAEMKKCRSEPRWKRSFSALQRAEIAEMFLPHLSAVTKSCFSALQRAEIAEIQIRQHQRSGFGEFQCSSTSRNC